MSVFLIFVIPGLDPAIQKIQGTALRYARRKHRASAKVLAAAGVAVKLATACAQGRPLVKPAMSYAGLTGETIKNVWIRWYFFGLPYFAG